MESAYNTTWEYNFAECAFSWTIQAANGAFLSGKIVKKCRTLLVECGFAAVGAFSGTIWLENGTFPSGEPVQFHREEEKRIIAIAGFCLEADGSFPDFSGLITSSSWVDCEKK